MKITEMLQREDFYSVNEKTLAEYYKGRTGESTLYVYPRLNAEVTKKPSSRVRGYLRNEYSVRGSVLKKKLVRSYVAACLASGGKLADKKLTLGAAISDDTLVYPCNKKYRIFDFGEKCVDVIAKSGFSDGDLRREIEFRTKRDLPAFVPEIVSHTENTYREKIIDGLPLARVSDGFERLKDEALKQLREYARDSLHALPAKSYAEKLWETVEKSAAKVKNKERLREYTEGLCAVVEKAEEITVGFSHGDFQAGNIWVENKTGKIYIIDWESWGERCAAYDETVLFTPLRSRGVSAYLAEKELCAECAAVLLEDLIFRLSELESLPGEYGESGFAAYLDDAAEAINKERAEQ